MTNTWRIFLVMVLVCPGILRAHNPDQEDHLLNMRITPAGMLLLDVWVSHGDLLGRIRRDEMDIDRDGSLSDREIRAYALRKGEVFREGVRLEINGQAVPLTLLDQNITIGYREVIPKGFWMSMTLGAHLDSTGGASRHVRVMDTNNLSVVGLIDIQLESGAYTVEGLEEFLEQGLLRGCAFTLVSEPEVSSGEYAFVLRTPIPSADTENVARTMFAFMRTRGVTEEQALELFQARTGQGAVSTLEEYLQADYGVQMILMGLGLAFFFGAFHALTPGHGKTIVAAYLVGSRGRVQDAVFLGGVVTFTHVFSVVILSLVVLFLSEYVLPQELFPWLAFSSGLLIVIIGMVLLRQRARQIPTIPPTESVAHTHTQDHSHHDHPAPSYWGKLRNMLMHNHGPGGHTHDHGHEHHHDHTHEHGHGEAAASDVSMKSLLGLGITGGIVPCPEALVVLLFAIDIHRYLYGLLMIVVFSLGLAAVLILIGVLMVTGSPMLRRLTGRREASLVRGLGIGSAAVIMLMGMGIMAFALRDARVLTFNF